MRLRYLLAALAVSVAWGGGAEAAPKAKTVDLDRIETAYAQYRYRHVERRPRVRRVVYRNWGPRRSVRVVRYARPVRYVRPYRYYRPARVVRYGYPYGYYSPYYYRPARYYAGYGWPYYRRPYFGGPYGGISIGVGF
ncbi:MAG TPA: hypothetical protein VEZ16_17930 [Microvirga sp.]|nr:hypothetical protein [Microvirga sp.]